MNAAYRITFGILICVAVGVLVPATPVHAYDGPAGVTFRAPLISKTSGSEVIGWESVSVKVKVRPDDNWSLEVDGRGRAFPDGFVATTADTEIVFGLRNPGRRMVKTAVLIPFDSSATTGTGFTGPSSINVSLNGMRVDIYKGPELLRGMMKVRSFRVPLEIPAESAVEVRITASHPLGVNPAWYRFLCTDTNTPFPGYRHLMPWCQRFVFEFDCTDTKLNPFTFAWKKVSGEPVAERKHGSIEFSGEAVEWIRVSR